MNQPVLVCFAVLQEARSFQRMFHKGDDVRVMITGMGAINAEKAVRFALEESRPARVFTCGFAGALNPELQVADVVCARTNPVAGARPIQFHCADRVVVRAAEKAELRARTGADAVEMESSVIERICDEADISCLTVRAISDAAHEDLPLDFNALMTHDQRLNPEKLVWAVMKSPQKIPALVRLGRNSARAAERLAEVLAKLI